MKKKMLLMSLLTLGTLAAEESITPAESRVLNQQYGYASIGLGPFPIPLPVFGVGYRTQTGHYGADLSLQVATVVEVTALKTNLLYLHHFKPSYASEFYAGGGIAPGMLLGHGARVFISPEFVIGKQYRNESDNLRFFQMQVSFPTILLSKDYYYHYHRIMYFPLVVLSYGLGF